MSESEVSFISYKVLLGNCTHEMQMIGIDMHVKQICGLTALPVKQRTHACWDALPPGSARAKFKVEQPTVLLVCLPERCFAFVWLAGSGASNLSSAYSFWLAVKLLVESTALLYSQLFLI